MKSKLLVFLFFAAIASASANWNNYFGLSKKECESHGSTCSNDCTKILACPEIGEPPIEFRPCNKNTDGHAFCKEGADGATCSSDIPDCAASREIQVVCGGYLEYPHPILPQVTIRCSNVNQLPDKLCYCPEGSFVNTVDISLPCNHLAPDYSAIQCSHLGETGHITDNYCFICNDNGIFVYGCSKTYYDNIKADFGKTCVPYPSFGTGLAPSSTTANPLGINCDHKGELVPDPKDCHSYYFCDSGLSPQHRTCSKGQYFHGSYCAQGDC